MPLKVNRNDEKLKILITSPSLSESDNVSGISTLVRQIIENGDCEFRHFTAGRKDGEKIRPVWILKQIFLPLNFLLQIFTKHIDIVHINTALVPLSIYRDFFLTVAAKFAGRPVLLHLHGGRFLLEDVNDWSLHYALGEMLQTADKLLVLSDLEKQSLLRRRENLHIEVLPNAVNTGQTVIRKEENKTKTLIFLGRIHESKGLDEIIESCRVIKQEGFDFRFKCYGTGPQEKFFIGKMEEILGDRFYYGGVVGGQEKWTALAEADILFLPSRYGEGLPVAMLEAMAAKCVPLVADVASVRTVITDGFNGFMIEPYNVEQNIEKLKLLLTDEVDWEALRNNARQTIVEKFSIADYVLKLQGIYREIGR